MGFKNRLSYYNYLRYKGRQLEPKKLGTFAIFLLTSIRGREYHHFVMGVKWQFFLRKRRGVPDRDVRVLEVLTKRGSITTKRHELRRRAEVRWRPGLIVDFQKLQ